MTIQQILQYLESLAPKGAAMSYDNVGLQAGDSASTVKKVLIALDLTPQIIQEALTMGANLIITHHPNIFLPLKSVTPNSLNGAMLMTLLENKIAHYAIHTNLDAMHKGVSFALGAQIGLENMRFLEPLPQTMLKLVVFVDAPNAQKVRNALANAGAGQIGAYQACAYESNGNGFFTPQTHANPFIGVLDKQNQVAETKIEVVLEKWKLGQVLSALKAHHPYEEIAYEVYELQNGNPNFGMGAIGVLPKEMPLSHFLKQICQNLGTTAVRYCAPADKMIKTVAVCGGSGSSLIGLAMAQGADAYVTGDLSYHQYFSVYNSQGIPQMSLIDVGHYESEACTEDLLLKLLQEQFPSVSINKTSQITNANQIFRI